MFEYNPMLVPSTLSNPPISFASPELLMHHNDQSKVASGHLYYRQQHTVQIIQLVEGPPPPPRHITSVINSSSLASSSSSCPYSSEDESDSDSSPSDGEDESACSSYCSSDMPSEHHPELPSTTGEQSSLRAEASDTYSIRMKRILAWRENFSTHMAATLSGTNALLSSPLKRKLDIDEIDDDSVSQSSKRSRSHGGASSSSSSLDPLSCPACDRSFSTRQSLRKHGLQSAQANEACCVAVEYAFE